MDDLDDIKEKYTKLKGSQEHLSTALANQKRSLTITNVKIKDLEEVLSIWIEVGKKIHSQTTKKIEAIVTTAIRSIFEKNYTFKLSFQEKRGTITCTPLVIVDDEEFSPKDSMGGGILDIIGFVLRITLQSIQNPRTRNVFILDEPFKFCGDLTLKAALMLKNLSKKLKFQVLLVTHNVELKEACDKVWVITNKRRTSRILPIAMNMIGNMKRIIKRRT
jgi:DNA repair exonuclease SbcCD ATPase subunit